MTMKKAKIRTAAAAGLLAAALVLPSTARAVRFSHEVHREADAGGCATCHLPGAHSIIPDQKVCLPCHQEQELADTPLGPTRTHTAFWIKQHGSESAQGDAVCRSCHRQAFCLDCHAGGEISPDLRRKAGRVDVPPRTHTADFRVLHPLKAAGEQILACRTCHKDSFCSDCHLKKTPPDRLKTLSHRKSWDLIASGNGPALHRSFSESQCQDCHPGGALGSREWSGAHAQEARRNLASCQSCHPEGGECLRCHSAKSGLKVSPHPSNWRKIQNKFRKESPRTCEKCHLAGSY